MNRQKPKNERTHAHAFSSDGPAVIPLQLSGSFDTGVSSLSSESLMSTAMINACLDNDDETAYLIQYGSKPLRDFGQPSKSQAEAGTANDDEGNLFERAYPCLYPYGVGGIEGKQLSPLDFRAHVNGLWNTTTTSFEPTTSSLSMHSASFNEDRHSHRLAFKCDEMISTVMQRLCKQ